MARNSSTGGAIAGTSKRSVEVLLAETVDKLGEQGDIVRVRAGYARNFLLPQGLATIATEQNKRQVDRHRERVAAAEASRIKGLRDRAEAISKYSVTLEANANKEGHLYGSIMAPDIAKALSSAGYEVTAEHIQLEGPLKELGMYTVKFELHPKAKGEVKVWVVPKANL